MIACQVIVNNKIDQIEKKKLFAKKQDNQVETI